MNDTLLSLVKLQQLDIDITRLESTRGDLPHQVSRLKQEMEEKKQEIDECTKKLNSYQKELGVTKLEIEALKGKKKLYQARLYQVKNNREYDAVTHEVEAVTASIESMESRLLELMDLEEQTKKSLEDFKLEQGKLDSQFTSRSTELKKRMEQTEKEELTLQDQRGKLVHRLEPRLISSYERIKKAKHGLAVVPVKRGSCGGCYKNLPPQRILEIREMNRMQMCESCGRILVWDEKTSETQE